MCWLWLSGASHIRIYNLTAVARDRVIIGGTFVLSLVDLLTGCVASANPVLN